MPAAATRGIRCLVTLGLIIHSACSAVHAEEPVHDPWLEWDYATGDWDGNRRHWSKHGVDILATYTAQVWGNPVGGLDPGTAYVGLLQFGVNADLEKALGWNGGSFRTTWLWMSGGEPSVSNVGSIFAVSPIEAPPSFRALDIWLQQEFRDGALALRAGLFNADAEFTVSSNAALFQYSGFGWPTFYGGTLGGAPVYPFAAPGIFMAVAPGGGWKWISSVMQGDAGSQADNPSNFYWRFNRATGCLILNEIQHSRTGGRLPGTAKMGAIFNTAETSDIAGNASSWSGGFVYGILDQMIWREDAAGAPQGASWFARGGYSVLEDSQLYSLFNTGFTCTGLIPGRDDDTAGVALSWAQFSPGIWKVETGGSRWRWNGPTRHSSHRGSPCSPTCNSSSSPGAAPHSAMLWSSA
ncbi:MAG: carbohydrate porin [Chthoniobacterales bacterium]|nr:carbohydrate porin [Chthoniobacterales bacterium]